MVRPDRRIDLLEYRPLTSSMNLLHRVDGSARFCFGQTSVIASVCGPTEVTTRDEKLDEATVQVVVRPATGFARTKEKLMESILRTAFEPMILTGMMPRTLIELVVQIEKDDGAALSAAINALTLALVDAGVPLKGMISSTTCIIDKTTDDLLLDPTHEEIQNAASIHTFAFNPSITTPHTILTESSGQFSEKQLFECLETCFTASSKLNGFLRVTVESKKTKEYQQLHE
ncbi:ribosomal protein S5 domain 2-like protein [Hesseltinella vesiculosa]|uniref:Ribosomal protein S5 domain 2-like protein n=1 Tax=Hesseltinella vesiculosa TaxID=101127 RepID=A0A1X2GAF5_9FUNG|nr:ribosomal protein S5 domain 2-like protein [Hesseltinella vesiculosa]